MGVRVFFVDIKCKCVCILCRDTFQVFKRGILERHIEHISSNSSLRQGKLKTIKSKLNQEQSIIKNQN